MYLTQGLRRAAKAKPDEVALEDGDAVFTWAAFQDRAARLAGGFEGLGLTSGDRIAMLGVNTHRYIQYF